MPTLNVYHAHEDHNVAINAIVDVMRYVADITITPTLACVDMTNYNSVQYVYGDPYPQQVTVKVFTDKQVLKETFVDTTEAQAFFKLWLERLWN